MNLRIITKHHAADPEIGFLTKSITKPNGRATAMPTAWELRYRTGGLAAILVFFTIDCRSHLIEVRKT